jgi:branched-chain amino acid transport system substrate-binding protein
MRKTIWVVIILVVAIIAIVLISRGNKTVSLSNNSIKIGAILPMTGAGAAYGENQGNAIKLAVKEINAAGGIHGKKLEVIFEDDHTDPKTTVTSAQKLINVDKVQVMIGGVWNHLAEAVIPVIDKAKVVLVSPTVSADSLSSKSPYVVFTFPTIASNEAVFKQFLSKYHNAKIAIMIWDNTWGTAHADEFKKAIEATGNTLVKEVIMPLPDNNDVRGQLTLLKALNPDVIFTALNFGDASTFAKVKSQLGIKAVAFNHYNLASAYENGLISQKDMDGYYFFRPTPPTADFINKYKKEYRKEPNIPDADSAYDAVYVIKLALENNGGKNTPDDIISGIRKIKNYQGASGSFDYTVNNWPQNKVPYLELFKDGKFVPVQN